MVIASSPLEVGIPYSAPKHYGKAPTSGEIKWHLNIEEPTMREHGEFVLKFDPVLDVEDVAFGVYEKYGEFLCRYCGKPLVFDGSNGVGTRELLCKHCKQKMSVWNTYELTLFKYKKILFALLAYYHCNSIEGCGKLYGIGKGMLNEVRMCLPVVKYFQDGESNIIEYEGIKYGVITIDMIYKGYKGLMLGVCGGLKIGSIGNETTGEGLCDFFDLVEKEIISDRYIFIMDMKINVAKMILERWGEKAIIVLQNHNLWGDVYVYFHHNGWYTLRLRTDTFAEVSMKRNEYELLPPGVIELYEGLKGVSHRASLKDLREDTLQKLVEKLLVEIRIANWKEKGRVDLVMGAKLKRLNTLLREMQRRKIDITRYLSSLSEIIEKLKKEYKMFVGRVIKRKIVNAWRFLTILKNEVNGLALDLLREKLDTECTKRNDMHKEKKKQNKRVKIYPNAKLVYRGQINHAFVPEPAQWVMNLLRKIFIGKEITTNACEGTFGNMGVQLSLGRSISIDRALTKTIFEKQKSSTTLSWLITNYPIRDMGKRGTRGSQKKLQIGGRYKIIYRNKWCVESKRIIDVINRKKKWIIAFCHSSKAMRTFRRDKIKNIVHLQSIC